MDVGGATDWSPAAVVGRAEILALVGRAFGEPELLGGRGAAAAERFRLADGTVFGVVAGVTAPFCGACVRSRLTADGSWYHCLYAAAGVDLKGWLRSRLDDDAILARMAESWQRRADRSAEERASLGERGALFPGHALRDDPHLEMHTRGG
jgi:cyclic pyranopterin phosphate synthase